MAGDGDDGLGGERETGAARACRDRFLEDHAAPDFEGRCARSEVPREQRQGGRGHPVDPRSPAQRVRADPLELLDQLVAEARQPPIHEGIGDRVGAGADHARRLPLLAREIAGVAERLRHHAQVLGREAAQRRAHRRQPIGLHFGSPHELRGARGCLEAQADRGKGGARGRIGHPALTGDRFHRPLEPLPARSRRRGAGGGEETDPRAVRREPARCGVDSQEQPVLRARGEQAVGLARAARHEIVDQDAEVRLLPSAARGAARRPRPGPR